MVGLLLMIRINYQHRLLMNKRRIPCLDDYLDRVNLQLWPRFKVPANGSTCYSVTMAALRFVCDGRCNSQLTRRHSYVPRSRYSTCS